jgi:hypothetical protein
VILFPQDRVEETALTPKKTYSYQGRQIPGESVSFESASEPFNVYKLSDGTEVKLKVVLLDAVRLDEYSDNGEPLYQFQFQQIIGINAPEQLKRKAQ